MKLHLCSIRDTKRVSSSGLGNRPHPRQCRRSWIPCVVHRLSGTYMCGGIEQIRRTRFLMEICAKSITKHLPETYMLYMLSRLARKVAESYF